MSFKKSFTGQRKPLPELTPEQKLNEKIFYAQLEFGFVRVSDLARSLEEEVRGGKHERLVCQSLLDCAENVSHKCRLYAALAGLVNARLASFGALVAEQCCLRLASALHDARWALAAVRLRVLCELAAVRLLAPKAVAAVLRQLLAPEKTSRAAVACVLSVLPFIGRSLAVKEPQTLDAVLKTIEEFVQNHGSDFSTVYCPFTDIAPASCSQLSWMWEQVSSMKRRYWEGCTETIPPLNGSFEAAVDKAVSHMPSGLVNLSFALRSVDESTGLPLTVVPSVPLAQFRLFSPSVTEKECSGVDRMVVQGYLVDLMRSFCESPDYCALAMLELPMRYPIDHVIVETVFGELLALPKTELRPAFYYALLNCLCRGQAGRRFAPVISDAFDELCKNISRLDFELRERCSECMAFHLGNSNFTFDWRRWDVLVAGLSEDDPRMLYVRSVLARACRLSYPSRVERNMPSGGNWASFLPPPARPDTAAVPVDVETAAAVRLGKPLDATVSLEAMVPALLEQGNTHSLAKLVLRQYGVGLRTLASSDDAKSQILRIIGSFWNNSEGHRLMIVDLFMSSMIVDNLSIVHWVFSEHSSSLLTYNPWEILHMAFAKTVNKTEFLRSKNLTSKLDAQLREEKDLFLTTFQRFVIVLESYLASSGAASGTENNWFRTVLAQMQAFARRYRSSIQSFIPTLEAIVFSDDCDSRIRDAFKKAIQ